MRVDQLPENEFAATLRNLQVVLEELKSQQPSGSDSNKIYRLVSVPAYDTFLDIAAGTSDDVYFTLDFAHQDYGYGVIAADVYKDSITPANKLRVGDVGMRDFFSTTYPPEIYDPRSIGFQLGLYNDDSVPHRYYFKFYYLTTDTF